MSQSISQQVQQSGLVGGTAPVTTSIFNPAPARERTPGNETPIFIAVWGGLNGRQPVLRVIDHTTPRFTINGTPSHCVDLEIPSSVNLRNLRTEVDTLIRAVRAQHDIYEKQAIPNWQDWTPAKIESAMAVFNKLAIKYGCTRQAANQQPYRARGESRTPSALTSTTDAPNPFDPANLDA